MVVMGAAADAGVTSTGVCAAGWTAMGGSCQQLNGWGHEGRSLLECLEPLCVREVVVARLGALPRDHRRETAGRGRPLFPPETQGVWTSRAFTRSLFVVAERSVPR